MTDPKPTPRVDESGVPWCRSECSMFRSAECGPCSATGSVCTPAIRQQAAELVQLRSKLADMEQRRCGTCDYGWSTPASDRRICSRTRKLESDHHSCAAWEPKEKP